MSKYMKDIQVMTNKHMRKNKIKTDKIVFKQLMAI